MEIKYFTYLVIAISLASISQILLKISANRVYKRITNEYINSYVIIGYIMLLMSTLFTTLGYKKIPLSYTPFFNGIGYVLIGVMSYTILKEKITKKQIYGYILIIIGMIVMTV